MTDFVDQETICPLCLERYPAGTFSADYPCCPDCGSEGMDFDVEPFTTYMATKTIADFDAMLAKWDAVEGFLPRYKEMKRDRIVQLRLLKAEEAQ